MCSPSQGICAARYALVPVAALVKAEDVLGRHGRAPREGGVLPQHVGHGAARHEVVVHVPVQRPVVVLPAHVAVVVRPDVEVRLRGVVQEDAVRVRRPPEVARGVGIGLDEQGDGAVQRLRRVQRPAGLAARQGRADVLEVVVVELRHGELVLGQLRPRLLPEAHVQRVGRIGLEVGGHLLAGDVHHPLPRRVAADELPVAVHRDGERLQGHLHAHLARVHDQRLAVVLHDVQGEIAQVGRHDGGGRRHGEVAADGAEPHAKARGPQERYEEREPALRSLQRPRVSVPRRRGDVADGAPPLRVGGELVRGDECVADHETIVRGKGWTRQRRAPRTGSGGRVPPECWMKGSILPGASGAEWRRTHAARFAPQLRQIFVAVMLYLLTKSASMAASTGAG
jgi:hypothetical protein